MLVRKFSIAVAAAAAMITPSAFAQTSASSAAATTASATASQQVPDGGMPTFIRPETPEKRRERLGTVEDPGINPDPNKHFWRFGKSFHIAKFERRFTAYDTTDSNY